MTDYLLDDDGLAEFKKKQDERIKINTLEIYESEDDMVGPAGLVDFFGGLIFGFNEEGEPGFRVGLNGEFISFGGKSFMEKLLWSNPDTAQTSFDATTVEVDLTMYEYVGIEYWHFGQGTEPKIAIFPIKQESYYTAIASAPVDFTNDAESYSPYTRVLPIRPIVVSRNSIQFFNSWSITVDGNNDWNAGYADASDACVPIRIFALQ